MEKTKRDAATREDRSPLTSNSVKETGYPQTKPNRQKKQVKLIQANRNFNFYFDERGICCYTKRKVR